MCKLFQFMNKYRWTWNCFRVQRNHMMQWKFPRTHDPGEFAGSIVFILAMAACWHVDMSCFACISESPFLSRFSSAFLQVLWNKLTSFCLCSPINGCVSYCLCWYTWFSLLYGSSYYLEARIFYIMMLFNGIEGKGMTPRVPGPQD